MPYLSIDATLKFEQRDHLGGGGEAEVFTAHDPQLNALLAVKKIPITRFSNVGEYFKESQKLYLTRHHNIVEILYGCQDAQYVYLAMPLCTRGSLTKIMANHFLESREIIRYALQFLSGLNNVHVKGLVHGDVKCENVLISHKNIACLSDFGLAMQLNAFGLCSIFETTPIFAPPEFFNHVNHNKLFDIYQAGICLYRMCSGMRHFHAQYVTAAAVNGATRDLVVFAENVNLGKFPDRKFWLPHIPKQLRKVINTALAVNPDDRYQTVIDFLNALSEIDAANGWQYVTDYADNEEWRWEKRTVKAKLSNGEWSVEARKNTTRKTKYCQSNLNLKDKNVLLYKCLNEDW